MKIRYVINQLLFMFSTIVTAQVIYFVIRSLFITSEQLFSIYDLQTILLSSFAGICPMLILYLTSHVSRKTYFTLVIPFHLLITLSSVIGVLIWRGTISLGQIFIPVPLFLALYIGFHIQAEIKNKKAVDELNRRIGATHRP